MKEIYAWVPWFEELGRKIAEGGEKYLIDRAKKVKWGTDDPALLMYGDENIDPFSFFYFLARNKNRHTAIYESVSQAFGIDSKHSFYEQGLENNFIFPPATQSVIVLFHDNANGNPDLLWRLFRQAVRMDKDKNAEINQADFAADFADALKIKNVGVTMLTQCLFLINPHYFMPVDERILTHHNGLTLPSYQKVKKNIEESNGWEYYKETILDGFRTSFPECAIYEIYAALYYIWRWQNPNDKQKEPITIGKNFFQVSTNVRNDGVYHDESFFEGYHVYTGDIKSGIKQYPLDKPSRGDIILVRRGLTEGKAIGIVYENDYADKGLTTENVIHVLWLNKTSTTLAGKTVTLGFSFADKTYQVFRNTVSYQSTFKLIEHISGEQVKPKNEDKEMNQPLNQILYGPPGTGKTWNTVNHALAIIEGRSVQALEKESRDAVKQRFDALKECGQIEMVTFHQSFSYEDFVEGIKPVLDDSGDGSGDVKYEIVDGVFKRIADRANENLAQLTQPNHTGIDLGALLEAYADDVEERLQEGEEIKLRSSDSKIDYRIGAVNRKNELFKSITVRGAQSTWITRIARRIIERDYEKFCNKEIKSHSDIRPSWSKRLKAHPQSRPHFALFGEIKKFQDRLNPEAQPKQAVDERRNYVLIIDEINRGNIAKIFGELITLIEDTKRIGGTDATTVTLPYSSNNDDEYDSFGVPNNLYIVGTMNTADRSIALLDTALRRRFSFIEMMPVHNHPLIEENVEGVNCQELLQVMNERITILFDREHQIGHSYLIDVDSMDKLAKAFKKEIIPLLQEYFYDDWGKIRLVLNNNKFVTATEINDLLLKNSKLVDTDRLRYELINANDPKWTDPKNYQKIYDTKASSEGEGENDVDNADANAE